MGLWTPSGCRLVCSLRQARAQAGNQTQTLSSLYRANAPLSLEVGSAVLWPFWYVQYLSSRGAIQGRL